MASREQKRKQRPTDPGVREVARAVAVATVVVAGLLAWGFGGRSSGLLTPFMREGLPPLRPVSVLYAFWLPALQGTSAAFLVLAGAVIAGAPRLVDPARTPSRIFGGALFLLALLLPLALFAVREPIARLGQNFLIYPGEEYYFDALRIRDLSRFLHQYVALNPELSLHGRTHPPGNAAILYLAGQLFGMSPLTAGALVLAAFAAGAVVAYRALAGALGEQAGRTGALLVLASPSILDFACTSMDAVFFTAAAIPLYFGVHAFAPSGRLRSAAAAGASLFAAALLSFSAFPVGLFLGVYGSLRGARARPAAWVRTAGIRLGVIAAAFVLTGGIFFVATGFDLLACLGAARKAHVDGMGQVMGGAVSDLWGPLTFGNSVALLAGLGGGLSGLVLLRVWHLGRRTSPAPGEGTPATDGHAWLAACAGTLLVLCAGGLYTMEVERIFLFAFPWIAGAALEARRPPTPAGLRLLVGVALIQSMAMEAALFTLW